MRKQARMSTKTPHLADSHVQATGAYDVIVVGLGFAGAMAAISAHDQGARVAIFEKSEHFGGISIISGGSCITGTTIDDTLQYLLRTCSETTDRSVVEVFARGLVELPAFLREFAAEVGFEAVATPAPPGYPFPGAEQLNEIYITRNEKYKGFPWLRGERAGATLFWVVVEQLRRRPEIDIYYRSRARELVTDGAGAVIGATVEQIDGLNYYVAKKGIVLCTGGFEHDIDMIRQHMPLPLVGIGPVTHTGDGVRMAQRVGAGLWHMWLVHGGYGFHVPGVPVAVRHTFDGHRDPNRKMPWIAVDQTGNRFMNEYPPAVQDTPVRAFEYYDPDLQTFPRVPSYLVFDEEGRTLGPLGRAVVSSEEIEFRWSDDNVREIEDGLIKRAQTVDELATLIGIDGANLCAAVERWNEAYNRGRDLQFHRPVGTMMRIVHPPFYAIPTWPILSNTLGGPVHDEKQHVLDSFGRRIVGLYAAGELGSVFGHLYLLGGNLSECFIGGRIAGTTAAAEAAR